MPSRIPSAYSPLLFSFIICLGGVYYGFFVGELYQKLDYPFINFDQNLSNINYSLFNSLFPAGCFLGTIIAGFCTFRFGRMKTLFYTDIMTIIGMVLQLITDEFEPFFIGRFLMGLSAGINLPLILLIIKEFVLEKDYLKCVVYFQLSNCFGILLSNLLLLTGIWKLAIGVSLVFPVIRGLYCYFMFIKLEIDTPTFMLYYKENNEKECIDKLLLIFPKDYMEKQLISTKKQETLLNKDFFMGNMFSPDYVVELMFCISILFVNQSSGINQILGYSAQFFPHYNDIIPLLFSIMVLIGGITLLFSVPIRNITCWLRFFSGVPFKKGFTRFGLGNCILIAILGYFAFGITYPDIKNPFLEDDWLSFSILGGVFLFVFQYSVGIYPFLYLPILLPDIGIFMVLTIHSTFGMIVSMSFYFGPDTFPVLFKFCFFTTIIGVGISIWLFQLMEGRVTKVTGTVDQEEESNEKFLMEERENLSRSAVELIK